MKEKKLKVKPEKEKGVKGKSSWYLPHTVMDAMELVKRHAKVPISGQLEMGAILYLEKNHKALLTEHGIDLWK